jgi:hypothetical protein
MTEQVRFAKRNLKEPQPFTFQVVDLIMDALDIPSHKLLTIQDAFFDRFETCLYLMPMQLDNGMSCCFYVQAARDLTEEEYGMYKGFIYGYIDYGTKSVPK